MVRKLIFVVVILILILIMMTLAFSLMHSGERKTFEIVEIEYFEPKIEGISFWDFEANRLFHSIEGVLVWPDGSFAVRYSGSTLAIFGSDGKYTHTIRLAEGRSGCNLIALEDGNIRFYGNSGDELIYIDYSKTGELIQTVTAATDEECEKFADIMEQMYDYHEPNFFTQKINYVEYDDAKYVIEIPAKISVPHSSPSYLRITKITESGETVICDDNSANSICKLYFVLQYIFMFSIGGLVIFLTIIIRCHFPWEYC